MLHGKIERGAIDKLDVQVAGGVGNVTWHVWQGKIARLKGATAIVTGHVGSVADAQPRWGACKGRGADFATSRPGHD